MMEIYGTREHALILWPRGSIDSAAWCWQLFLKMWETRIVTAEKQKARKPSHDALDRWRQLTNQLWTSVFTEVKVSANFNFLFIKEKLHYIDIQNLTIKWQVSPKRNILERSDRCQNWQIDDSNHDTMLTLCHCGHRDCWEIPNSILLLLIGCSQAVFWLAAWVFCGFWLAAARQCRLLQCPLVVGGGFDGHMGFGVSLLCQQEWTKCLEVTRHCRLFHSVTGDGESIKCVLVRQVGDPAQNLLQAKLSRYLL